MPVWTRNVKVPTLACSMPLPPVRGACWNRRQVMHGLSPILRPRPSRSHHAPITPGIYHRFVFAATNPRPAKEDQEVKFSSRVMTVPGIDPARDR